MLTIADLHDLFPNNQGIKLESIGFHNVSIFDKGELCKGLFIPLHSEQKLDKAIESGAIAALWPRDREIPFYTPNHFPIFIVENPLFALKQLCEHYIHKIEQEECEKMTKFILFSPELLNNHPFTYDLSEKGTGHKLQKTVMKLVNREERG
ncbi:MAG: hypothetical protein ACO1OT_16835 [Heyndrickxia sp.]